MNLTEDPMAYGIILTSQAAPLMYLDPSRRTGAAGVIRITQNMAI